MFNTLLKTKRVGLILRTYARREDDMESRLGQIVLAVDKAHSLGVFSRIDVLVWADKDYPADCGKTVTALRLLVEDSKAKCVVHEVKHGDLFCGLLNYGVATQLRDRIDYSVILSPDAHTYLTQETMDSVFFSAQQGCRAIGVAINELSDSVRAGLVSNTFAMWDNVSLVTAGAFDIRSAHVKASNNSVQDIKVWSEVDGEEVSYPLHGVEEVFPLLRMIELYGKCIGTVIPAGKGAKYYIAPDPIKDPVGRARHDDKMRTKRARQEEFARQAGYKLSFMKKGLLIKDLTVG